MLRDVRSVFEEHPDVTMKVRRPSLLTSGREIAVRWVIISEIWYNLVRQAKSATVI